MNYSSPHFSSSSAARRLRVVLCQDVFQASCPPHFGPAERLVLTEERAGIVDTMSSILTGRNPDRLRHIVVAVAG